MLVDDLRPPGIAERGIQAVYGTRKTFALLTYQEGNGQHTLFRECFLPEG